MFYDFVIVGQGIAGSVLSYILLQKKQKVLLINDTKKNCSSLVAGGIFNPITGKNLVKTWQADKLFPFMLQFYNDLEQVLATKFLHTTEIYRPFRNVQEQNDWLAKSTSTAFRDYLQETDDKYFEEDIFNPFGGIATLQAGWVDLPALLSAYREFLQKQNLYWEENFDENILQIYENKISYKSIEARYLIFCTGVEAVNSKFWSYLPFSPVKGETIDILVPNAKFENIVNQGVSIVPLGKQVYRVASTYDWKNLNWQCSEEAKQELTEKAKTILRKPFEVLSQKAGIRPATRHRRPILGLHPQYKNLVIFNGLGSKGVSLAPYWANHLVEHILEKKPLDSEVINAEALSKE
jgi:glycine/D-amino acid oxidase-like deaminating enzyme